MEQFNSTEELLDFAINAEQKAFNLYTKLATQSKSVAMAKIYDGFAADVMHFKSLVERIKSEKQLQISPEDLHRFAVNEYRVPNDYARDMSYMDALSLAILRGKAMFKMYNNLVKVAPSQLKETFHILAQNVAEHNLRFDVEYDEYVECTCLEKNS